MKQILHVFKYQSLYVNSAILHRTEASVSLTLHQYAWLLYRTVRTSCTLTFLTSGLLRDELTHCCVIASCTDLCATAWSLKPTEESVYFLIYTQYYRTPPHTDLSVCSACFICRGTCFHTQEYYYFYLSLRQYNVPFNTQVERKATFVLFPLIYVCSKIGK
jgi:hypothetical protein